MTPDLRSSCASCGHVEVLHDIRSNGQRGTCSVSTGAQAVPCGCPRFEAPTSPVQPETSVPDTDLHHQEVLDGH